MSAADQDQDFEYVDLAWQRPVTVRFMGNDWQLPLVVHGDADSPVTVEQRRVAQLLLNDARAFAHCSLSR